MDKDNDVENLQDLPEDEIPEGLLEDDDEDLLSPDDDDLADDEEIDESTGVRQTIKGNGSFSLVNSVLNLGQQPRSFKFICKTPNCKRELDVSDLSELTCPGCNVKYYNNNFSLPDQYKTLDPKESRDFNRIIAHINNKVRDKNFQEAYRYCQMAENVAPAEPITWEYFALIEFLHQVTYKGPEKKDISQTIRCVKNHLEKCKDHNIDDSRFEKISADIANTVFEWGKRRIPTIVAKRDVNGNAVWRLRDLDRCMTYMKYYDLSYSLNSNEPKFLDEYIKELCKDYKWIAKDRDGNLKNRVVFNGFKPVNKLRFLINAIRKHIPDYPEPDIAYERFEISKTEPVKTFYIEIINRTKK